uniref:IS21 transposase n=1 Tax=Bacillus cereus VPC1401 TaxID=870739 RepID=E5AK67_BACCE|nr:IS21 transposase fragment [Bacillus cereus VPC1401]
MSNHGFSDTKRAFHLDFRNTLYYLITHLSKSEVLIVYEMGYFPFDELAVNVFF